MAKDNLFELIQSMSKSEKRYFKLSSHTHSDNKSKYAVMFDLINTKNDYNEKEIKEKLKPHIKLKNFAVEKNYLYNSLLKNLTSFHNQKSLNSKASSSIFTIRMLLDKALYTQAKKLIDKIQKFAEQSENYTLLLEILKLKINYFETIQDNTGVSETFEKIFDIQNTYTNLEQLRFYHHKFYEKATQLGEIKRTTLLKQADDLMKKSILQKENNAISYEAKIRFNECWMLYHYIRSDFEKAFDFSKRSVDLSETTPYYMTEKRDNYISNLNNYVIFCNGLNKYKESENQIQKLKSFVTKDINSKSNISIFIGTALQETNLIILTANFEKLYQNIHHYETYLELFEEKLVLSHKYGLFINISLLYFINTDYKISLKWINKVLNAEEPSTRTDVIGFAWLFNLIIHFELGNYDYIEYLSKSTINALKKRNQFVQVSNLLVNSLLKLTSTNKNDEQNKIYIELKKGLLSDGSKNEKSELDYFDIEDWAESKIKNVSLAKILKNKTSK